MDCKGILGKLFGHKFKKYLNYEPPAIPKELNYEGPPSAYREFIKAFSNIYEIRCKRCGCKIESDKL